MTVSLVSNAAIIISSDNLVAYLLNLAKGFELVIIVLAVISFLLFNLFLTMIHLRKLPKYCVIEIVDSYGNKTAVEGLSNFCYL